MTSKPASRIYACQSHIVAQPARRIWSSVCQRPDTLLIDEDSCNAMAGSYMGVTDSADDCHDTTHDPGPGCKAAVVVAAPYLQLPWNSSASLAASVATLWCRATAAAPARPI
jgi:hypothetical protein